MKNIFIGTVALVLVMFTASSCKKAATVNGGSWSFEGQNYTVTSGIADVSQNPAAYGLYGIATLATACQSGNNYGSIVFTFFSYPTASGTYTITANQFPDSGSHEIAVNMILAKGSNYAQNNYNPTAFSAAGATANVTVGSNGWITIAIPSLEMVNAANAADSSSLTTNVKQTQAAE